MKKGALEQDGSMTVRCLCCSIYKDVYVMSKAVSCRMWCSREMVVVVAVVCAGGLKESGEELWRFALLLCLLAFCKKPLLVFCFGSLLVVVVVFNQVRIENNKQHQ